MIKILRKIFDFGMVFGWITWLIGLAIQRPNIGIFGMKLCIISFGLSLLNDLLLFIGGHND